jgi:ribosomal protein S18 acetylase RimI-like enzyme
VDAVLRPARPDDVEHIRWALYTALAWDPERRLPPPEATLEHPEAARYHQDWGRHGDLGVVAESKGRVVGVAYCRLFKQEDHGYGYVDDETPEVAVAVRAENRGDGLGTTLLNALADAAYAAGYTHLSLSVAAGNPARGLYERLGYRELSTEGDAVRMLLNLP